MASGASQHEDDRLTVRADEDGVIRFWGDGVAQIMGYTPEQAVGHRVDLIIPPPLHPWHWRGFHKAIRSGEMRKPGATVKVPAIHKDGRVLAVRAELGLTHDDNGTVDGAAATGLRLDPAWVAAAWKPVLGVLRAIEWLRRRTRRPGGH